MLRQSAKPTRELVVIDLYGNNVGIGEKSEVVD